MYTMSSVLKSEAYLDNCTELFVTRLAELADQGISVDLGLWLPMWAFDVVGELYFGSKFGFLETGKDVGGWIQTTAMGMSVFLTIANLPMLLRMPYILFSMLWSSFRDAVHRMANLERVAQDKVEERRRNMEASDGASSLQSRRKDILAKLFELHHTKGEKEDFSIADIELEGNVGVFAGSDTTAIALRATVHQILTHPKVLHACEQSLTRHSQRVR